MSSSGERADPVGFPPWSVDPADEEPSAAMEEQQDEGIDHFDRLPDSILLVVFNRIGDVRALGRCCVVSRRFQSLVPLVDDVVVKVDCVISDDPSPFSSSLSSSSSSSVPATSSDKARGVFSHLARLVVGGIVKPLHALGQMLAPSYVSSSGGATSASGRSSTYSSSSSSSSSSLTSSEVSHHSPTEVLRSFKEIRRLRIELPAGELSVDDGVLLKWKADFGSTLDRCTILGASSVLSTSPSSPSVAALPTSPKSPSAQDTCGGVDDPGSIPESFYSNGSLKLRVVWTISSLIAASARHYLLQPIIAEHETLESLDLTDTDGQGVLTMNRRQLQALRVKPVSASGNSQRTLVPALSMRLWYAAHMELPGGVVLKGATLVAITPTEEGTNDAASGGGSNGGCDVGSSDGCWISDNFEEPYRTAAKMLMKRRTYCLEMNSF